MTEDEMILLLRATRFDRGLTQTGVADIMGISKTQLCDYESGRSRPGLGILLRWIDALGLRLALVPVDGGA